VLLLRDHCTSPQFKFKTYNCSSIYQHYQPLYLPNIIFLALCFELFLNLRGKIEKILYRRCAPRALKNACDKMVSYKTRIINNYFGTHNNGVCAFPIVSSNIETFRFLHDYKKNHSQNYLLPSKTSETEYLNRRRTFTIGYLTFRT
jgi:hypothetical protein